MEEENLNTGPTLKERYEYLINARNFHYEHFNKWASYFYIIIGALLIAYFSIADNKNQRDDLEFLILILGFITSLIWFWSTKGYYYWNTNFIKLVSYYETDLFKWPEGKRVYAVFANKNFNNNYESLFKGANISTPKLTILLAYFVTLSWCVVLIRDIILQFHKCNLSNLCLYLQSIIYSIVIIYFLSKLIAKKYFKSDTESMPDLKLK